MAHYCSVSQESINPSQRETVQPDKASVTDTLHLIYLDDLAKYRCKMWGLDETKNSLLRVLTMRLSAKYSPDNKILPCQASQQHENTKCSI